MVVDRNRERDDFQVQSCCNFTIIFISLCNIKGNVVKSVGFVTFQFWELF